MGQHNFNVFWFDRGTMSFLFKMDRDLHNKFLNKQLNFHRNGLHSFEYLTHFNYSGWHLSRCQKPYSLLMKFLYLAETASLTFLTSICDEKEWTFRDLWNGQSMISMNILNISNNRNECISEILLNPYIAKPFFDNAVYANNVDNLRKLYQTQHTYPLPKYIVLNREKYKYFFPKWCKLKNINEPYK